jgi:iron(III) transport system permease protein
MIDESATATLGRRRAAPPGWQRLLLILPVVLFLLVFMLIPMVSLVLVSFTGEPVNIFGYLVRLDLGGFWTEVQGRVTLHYYAEFLDTRRYRQGFLNSVGVAPLAAIVAWLGAVLGRGLARLAGPAPARAVARLTGPVMGAAFLGAVALCLFWPLWAPEWEGGRLFAPGRTWEVRLLQSLGYCPLVTLATVAVAVALAFAVHRTDMPGRHWIATLSLLPLAVPSFLGALAFKNLLGDSGILTRLLETVHLSSPVACPSALAAGIVQTALFFPLVYLTTSAAMERLDPSLREAASVLGARSGLAFWTVTLPMLGPGITAGAFLVFIRCFGDFATLKLLLPMDYPMIVTEAYRDMSGSTYWGGASMLSTLMVAMILVLLGLQKYFIERGSYETVTGRGLADLRLATGPVRWVALAFSLAVLSVPLSFVAAIVLVSLSAHWGTEILPTAYTFERYLDIFRHLSEPHSPLVNSFALVAPALVGTVLLSLLVAWLIARSRHWSRHILDFATVLPFVVPGVAFAVALIGVFNGPPLALHLTAVLVVLAYIVTRIPYGVRSTLASFQQIGTSMEEASRTLGAPGLLTLGKVTVPLVAPGMLAGAIMVFISTMEDVAITLMVCPPDWYPASIYVFHRINQGDIFGSSAYGMVLLALVMVPYAIAYRLGATRPGT